MVKTESNLNDNPYTRPLTITNDSDASTITITAPDCDNKVNDVLHSFFHQAVYDNFKGDMPRMTPTYSVTSECTAFDENPALTKYNTTATVTAQSPKEYAGFTKALTQGHFDTFCDDFHKKQKRLEGLRKLPKVVTTR